MRRRDSSVRWSMAWLVLAAGCAAEPVVDLPDLALDEEGERPVGVYVVTSPADEDSDTEAALFAVSARRTLFLNRHGGTYRPGYDNSSANTSSIPGFTARVPAYEGTDAEWRQLLDCVKALYAPFNIEVTDVDPGDVPHVESVMGGGPGDVGMGSGVGGVAPMNGDCSPVERAVVYVFTRVFRSVQTECEVAGQESAHAYGLDHELDCRDPMTYLSDCGPKSFQDRAVNCGEYSSRSCMCGGRTQNSHQLLLTLLGANEGGGMEPPPPPPDPGGGGDGGVAPEPPGSDTAGPTVTISSPMADARLTANADLTVTTRIADPAGIQKAELLWGYRGTVAMDCAAPPAGVTCSAMGETYTWRFRVGRGTRSFSVRAIDRAGNATTSPNVNVTFGEVAPPPSSGPVVEWIMPAEGEAIRPGSTVRVRVRATDDTRVTQAWLEWIAPSATVQRTLSSLGRDEWGADIAFSSSARTGTTRTLRVVALDDAGNRTTSADRILNVR